MIKAFFKLCLTVLIVLVVLSFIGVEPLVSYKNNLIASQETGKGQPSPAAEIRDKIVDIVKQSQDIDTGNYAVLFNEYRQEQGLAPLVFTDDLNQVAQLRLAELRNDFSHQSKGSYNDKLAENIIKGVSSNQGAITVWKKSAGHKANMLNSTYRNTGYAADGRCAIQLFSSWDTVNGKPQLPPGYHW